MIREYITKLRAEKFLKELKKKVGSTWCKGKIVQELKYKEELETTLIIEYDNHYIDNEKYLANLFNLIMKLSVKYRLSFFGYYNKKLEIKIDMK